MNEFIKLSQKKPDLKLDEIIEELYNTNTKAVVKSQLEDFLGRLGGTEIKLSSALLLVDNAIGVGKVTKDINPLKFDDIEVNKTGHSLIQFKKIEYGKNHNRTDALIKQLRG
jgi:hypothetical protein